MSSFMNNGTSRWEDDQTVSGLYTSTSQQQHTPIVVSSSSSELQWTNELQPESHVSTGFAFGASSWPDAAFFDPPFSGSMYPGGVWPGDQLSDVAPLGSSFSVPGSNADGLGANHLMGMGVAAPVEPVIPAMQSALPRIQPGPPTSAHWTQAHGLSLQPAPWDHPSHSVGQHNNHNNSIGSLGMEPDFPHVQLAVPVMTGRSEYEATPASRLPSMTAPQSWPQSNPVPAAPCKPRPRGERCDPLMNTTSITFQCLWASGGTRCMAQIAGDRRSVTSHLRDEHDFVCDGRVIACAWDQCTTPMQRRNIPRHIIACHFEIKVTCPQCGMALSRADANKKHRLACTGGAAKAPAVTEGEEDDRRLFF